MYIVLVRWSGYLLSFFIRGIRCVADLIDPPGWRYDSPDRRNAKRHLKYINKYKRRGTKFSRFNYPREYWLRIPVTFCHVADHSQILKLGAPVIKRDDTPWETHFWQIKLWGEFGWWESYKTSFEDYSLAEMTFRHRSWLSVYLRDLELY